jgi:hypothetical protein
MSDDPFDKMRDERVDKTHPLSLERIITDGNRVRSAYDHYQLGGKPVDQGARPDEHRHTSHIDAPKPDSEIIKLIPPYMLKGKPTARQLADLGGLDDETAQTLAADMATGMMPAAETFLEPAAETFEGGRVKPDTSAKEKSPEQLQEYILAWKGIIAPEYVDELIALGRQLERACLCALLAAQPDSTIGPQELAVDEGSPAS